MENSIIVGALAIFFFLSVLTQVSRIGGIRSRALAASVLKRLPCRSWRAFPSWTFFSYVPDHDIRLLFRDELIDSQLTPWNLVYFDRNTAIKSLWNPDRRRQKAVIDLAGSLVSQIAELDRPALEPLIQARCYRRLVSYVGSLPRTNLTRSRQFLIAKTSTMSRPEKYEVLVVSPLNSVGSDL
jgi:hypothetical protein